ncbi:MAG: hypothetical protein WAV20_07880 [Blastocatellia bacterium]
MNSFNACSKVRTAAKVPGEGGFLGNCGSGFGASALLLARTALRDWAFDAFLTCDLAAVAILRAGRLATFAFFTLEEDTFTLFFFRAAFALLLTLIALFLADVARLTFLTTAIFLAD